MVSKVSGHFLKQIDRTIAHFSWALWSMIDPCIARSSRSIFDIWSGQGYDAVGEQCCRMDGVSSKASFEWRLTVVDADRLTDDCALMESGATDQNAVMACWYGERFCDWSWLLFLSKRPVSCQCRVQWVQDVRYNNGFAIDSSNMITGGSSSIMYPSQKLKAVVESLSVCLFSVVVVIVVI